MFKTLMRIASYLAMLDQGVEVTSQLFEALEDAEMEAVLIALRRYGWDGDEIYTKRYPILREANRRIYRLWVEGKAPTGWTW